MISDGEIERILLKFGNDWPASASIVEAVVRRLPSRGVDPPETSDLGATGGSFGPPVPMPLGLRTKTLAGQSPRQWHPQNRDRRTTTISPPPYKTRRLGALAAAAALVCAIGTWFYFGGQSNSLSAQVIRAMDGAKSLSAVTFIREIGPHGEDRGLKKIAEARFIDGQGFRYDWHDEIRVGNDTAFWRFNRRTKTAFRSASGGIRKLVNDWFDVRKFAAQLESDFTRDPAADTTIKNERLTAYLLTGTTRYADRDLKEGRRRLMVFLDSRSRIARIEHLERQKDAWQARSFQEWSYDVAVDPKLFEPDFGPGVKVVDTDRAFDELVDLQHALHVENRSGLIYAVHRIERFERGGLLSMSSVRGDEETLKQFPLERRMIQVGLYHVDGPATSYDAIQGNGYFRIPLARASHQGIEVQWWLQVPRGQPQTYFDVGPERAWIMAGITPWGNYAAAHRDPRFLLDQLMWKLELIVPKPQLLPTLSAIADSVYADAAALAALPPFDLSLDLGTADSNGQPTSKRGSPADTTPAQFAEAVERHVRWWFRQDVEFQFRWATNPASAGNETVALNYNPEVSDADLARVRSFPKLRRLFLAGTQITNAGLAAVSGLTQLKLLDLSNTAITDAGLEHLMGLHALKELYLKNIKLSDAAMERLKSTMPHVKVVRK